MARFTTRVKNYLAGVGRKMQISGLPAGRQAQERGILQERSQLARQAARGAFRENQLIVGKPHSYVGSDGREHRKTMYYSVSGRQLLEEKQVTEDIHEDGYVGRGVVNTGNWRRIAVQLARDIDSNLRDPDFVAAKAGDEAAKARWDARFAEHEKRREQWFAAKRQAPLKEFVDAEGKPVFDQDLTDTDPNAPPGSVPPPGKSIEIPLPERVAPRDSIVATMFRDLPSQIVFKQGETWSGEVVHSRVEGDTVLVTSPVPEHLLKPLLDVSSAPDGRIKSISHNPAEVGKALAEFEAGR